MDASSRFCKLFISRFPFPVSHFPFSRRLGRVELLRSDVFLGVSHFVLSVSFLSFYSGDVDKCEGLLRYYLSYRIVILYINGYTTYR